MEGGQVEEETMAGKNGGGDGIPFERKMMKTDLSDTKCYI